MRRFAALLILLVVALPFVSANHSQSEGGRVVVFDHKTGNEWWVEVILSGQDAGSVVEVWAMDGLDPWTRLQKNNWGAYGASFHLGPGAMVRFKAVWAGGAEIVSCYFTHPGGVERCDVPPTTTPPEFDASFSNVKGNDWWVEVMVTANQPLATVHARVNCAENWKALTLRSWGHWAASFYVAPGSKVDFLVTATRGQQDASGGYVWPHATATSACGSTTPTPTPMPTTFDATFANVKGNEWWVEAKVSGNQPITAVEARVDCMGDWKPLTLRSWGAWAGSFHVPFESTIDLRARSQSGVHDLSGGYSWPHAVPAAACFTADWPKEGNFALYHFEGEDRRTDPDGTTYHYSIDGTELLTWTAANGWTVACDYDATMVTTPAGGTSQTDDLSFQETTSYPPPRAPVPATIGSTVQVELSSGCMVFKFFEKVTEQTSRQTSLQTTGGSPLVVNAYHVRSLEGEGGETIDYWWEPKMGLMFEWEMSASAPEHGSSTHFRGDLIDTDAAI